jgi:hypothetical protein
LVTPIRRTRGINKPPPAKQSTGKEVKKETLKALKWNCDLKIGSNGFITVMLERMRIAAI